MAKRKRRRNNDSSGFKYPIEIKGIIFIVIAVIGFLGYKANILGKIIKGFAEQGIFWPVRNAWVPTAICSATS